MKQYPKKALEELRKEIDIERLLISLDYETKYETAVFDCPFCEKEGSFVIDTEVGDQKYYCFNCEAKGDAISLLMNRYKKSFQQAIEFLSTIFNIDMDADCYKDTEEERKNMTDEQIAEDLAQAFDALSPNTKKLICALAKDSEEEEKQKDKEATEENKG